MGNNIKIKALITSYQIIDDYYLNNNSNINLYMSDNNEQKIINLGNNRKIYSSKNYNTTIIELKDTDNINYFLDLDDNLFRNELKDFFKYQSIYILQYLFTGSSSVSYGIINEFNGFNMNHSCFAESGSIGAPILNLTNNKVIGISLDSKENNTFNFGFILYYSIQEFMNQNRNNNPFMNNNFNQNMNINMNMNNMNLNPNLMMNNNFIPNMMANNNMNFNQNMMINNNNFFPANNFQMNNMMINPNNFMQNNINMSNNIPQMNNNMVNYMISKEDEEWMKGFHMGVEKEMNSKPKIRVIFNTTQGSSTDIEVFFGTTINQLLEKYLKHIGRPDLIRDKSNKICFLFNATKIRFGDETTVEKFFKNVSIPKVVVNNIDNLIGG